MTTLNDNGQPIDPRLQELLDSLRETPPRSPEAEARGRVKFLAEVDSLFDQDTRPVFHQASKPKESRSKWRFSLAALQQRLAFTTLMAVFAILLLLFGGAGATAYASQGALPGDALYPVKTSLEQTQVRLARDAARQAELHLSFAERRLTEIASLIAEGDFGHIETATREFEAHVQEAILALETVSAGDPQRAAELATQITSALTRYAEILKGMLVSVPDTVKPSVEKAILISEQEEHEEEVEFTGLVESISDEGYLIGGQLVKITPQTEIKGTLGVGAMVKVHAMQAADGTLTAREIEVTLAGEENLNENENTNASDEIINANDNIGAANLNTNEIENENEIMNLSNEDDGMHNGNANQNMNDNTGNENSGSGSQGNMNNNDNSGGRNDNSGSGGMSNDNSGSGGGGNDNSGSGGGGNDSGGSSNDNS